VNLEKGAEASCVYITNKTKIKMGAREGVSGMVVEQQTNKKTHELELHNTCSAA